jgi:hypothetical protein
MRACLRAGRRCFLLPVSALRELLKHLLIESRNVIELASGHKPVVCNDLAIDPVSAGIDQIRLE